MGLKLSTKRRRGRSYSFTEKDKPTSEVANDSTVTTNGGGGGKGSKKSKRSVSSAAKFSSTARETYVPKVCYSCFLFCFVVVIKSEILDSMILCVCMYACDETNTNKRNSL